MLRASEEKAAWYNVIGKFKAKAREFIAAYNNIKARENEARKNPVLYREYRELTSRAGSIKTTIRKVTGGVDSVVNWFKGTFGFGMAQNMGSMGFIPLIPIAVVIGSVTLMSKWILDSINFSKKLDEIKRLEAKGVSPERAAAIVERLAPKSFGFNIKGMGTIAIAGLGLFVLSKFMRR